MKSNLSFLLVLFTGLLIISCKPNTTTTETKEVTETPKDTVVADHEVIIGPVANERFQDVQVKRLGGNKYEVTGKAQVFEAAFSWVVEDGHDELKSGHEMTDAGAPAWGNFKFTFEAAKKDEYSTLTLILFEVSAKDGSRQYELTIPLVF